MVNVAFALLLVLITIYIVPIIVYGAFSALFGLKTPEGASPSRFLLSVLVSKIGTAIAFVLLFYFAREVFDSQWLLYAGIWWVMFVLGEIGQTIGPNYFKKEAIAGVVSETVYLPISAYLVSWVI